MKSPPKTEIFILAGGLSTRMGRDKSRLRLGSRTLLGHIRNTARQLNLPVRIIRRDAVSRCGPIGGIYTALKKSRAQSLLFLACDMPFVTPAFLRKIIRSFPASADALFARKQRAAGFPCVIRRNTALPLVERQIARAEFSLQQLARALHAKFISPPRNSPELDNLNTPAEFQKANQRLSIKKPFPKIQSAYTRRPTP